MSNRKNWSIQLFITLNALPDGAINYLQSPKLRPGTAKRTIASFYI